MAPIRHRSILHSTLCLSVVSSPRGHSIEDPEPKERPFSVRVALISSSYHPYPGGVEEHTRNVARELRSAGHDVVVWTVDRGEELGTRSDDGIEVRYLPTPLPAASIQGLWRFTRTAPPAWRPWVDAVRDFRPDVLHIQCFGPNGIYATALHHRTGTPLVISSHGETFADESNVFGRSAVLRSGLRHALHVASAVTGCSSVVLEDLRARFGLKAGVVVPNGVDLDEAHALGARTLDHPARPTVFAVGRVVHVKGFDLLIRAFARANLPQTHLVIGGDGPELPRLRTLADELGVGERSSFPGRLDRADVIRGIENATIVAVPSRLEAFGIVVLEAWRGGAPVLATSRSGPATFVTDGVDGLLVDPEDTASFASALERLTADPDLRERLASAGRKSVTAYTWQRTASDYERIYEEIATRRRHTRTRRGHRHGGKQADD